MMQDDPLGLKRMQTGSLEIMMRLAVAVIALLASACAARAGDHPYAGLWADSSIEDADPESELSGPLGCFNKFTEQLPDGRFRYYLVDHEKWVREKKVEYLLAQEGHCAMNSDGRTEKCVGRVVGEKESEWFVAYESAATERVRATYYENVFYFEKRFNGEQIVRSRCSFDMATIRSHVSGKTIADCTTRCRAFGRSELSAFREMLEVMRVKQ